jgi:ABC-2 type transport system ATP-binding protein
MIRATALRKEYRGFVALDDVSFDLDDGTIFGVIGHNGAGKTTLLKILSGLAAPTSGTLSLDGVDITWDPARIKAQLGYLPEESRLYETMTVPGYLSFFGECYGLTASIVTERSHELLRSLALEPNGKKLGELSKGMKRKVAIARSLLHDPALLIYDEPTSGLDPMTSRSIVEYLKQLRSQGKTIVLSAHNLYQVEEICDRVLILRRGKEVACGSMQELRELFGSITYTVTFSVPDIARLPSEITVTREGGYCIARAQSIDAMNRITAAVAIAGGQVERIESRYPTLEEMLVKIGK